MATGARDRRPSSWDDLVKALAQHRKSEELAKNAAVVLWHARMLGMLSAVESAAITDAAFTMLRKCSSHTVAINRTCALLCATCTPQFGLSAEQSVNPCALASVLTEHASHPAVIRAASFSWIRARTSTQREGEQR